MNRDKNRFYAASLNGYSPSSNSPSSMDGSHMDGYSLSELWESTKETFGEVVDSAQEGFKSMFQTNIDSAVAKKQIEEEAKLKEAYQSTQPIQTVAPVTTETKISPLMLGIGALVLIKLIK